DLTVAIRHLCSRSGPGEPKPPARPGGTAVKHNTRSPGTQLQYLKSSIFLLSLSIFGPTHTFGALTPDLPDDFLLFDDGRQDDSPLVAANHFRRVRPAKFPPRLAAAKFQMITE